MLKKQKINRFRAYMDMMAIYCILPRCHRQKTTFIFVDITSFYMKNRAINLGLSNLEAFI